VFVQFVKYNLVGIVNTFVGFSIVFLLMYMGFSAILSNVVGYTIGSVLSYVLNSKYTFDATHKHQKVLVKFFMVLAIAYALNFMTLQYVLTFMTPYLAQLCAAVVYTLSSFLMMRFFVFKDIK